jgi:hypothetical protein
MPPSLSVKRLLERSREIRAIDALITEATAGNAAVLIVESRPGLGKTALLRVAATRAAEAGLVVASTAGAELEREHDFALLDRLLGQPRPTTRGEEAQVMADALARLSSPAGQPNPLIVVDDLQWADPASARFLEFAIQRGRHCVLAATTPVPAQDCRRRLAARDGAEVVRLEPLSAGAARRILDPAPEEDIADLIDEAGGNPFLLAQLARQGDRSVPERVTQWVTLRLAALPDECNALAAAIGVLGPRQATLGRVAELAGLDPSAAAAAADQRESASLVRRGEPRALSEQRVARAGVE